MPLFGKSKGDTQRNFARGKQVSAKTAAAYAAKKKRQAEFAAKKRAAQKRSK